MSYIQHQLTPNERILVDTELHWIIFAWPIFIAIACIVFMFRQHFMFELNYVAIALMVYFLGDVLIQYVTTSYALTNFRAIIKQGLLFVRVWDISLNRVESVEIQQSLLGRLLGYGNVIVSGTGGDHVVFNCVEDATSFRQKILEAMEGSQE